MLQTTGVDGIRIGGSIVGTAPGMANGVHIDQMTILTTSTVYPVEAIRDGGYYTSITNCILGTAASVSSQTPGYGVYGFRTLGENLSGNNFSLCAAGYYWYNVFSSLAVYDSSNNSDSLGVTGDGSLSSPWMNVPKGGVN
jgi:hypothetical protein